MKGPLLRAISKTITRLVRWAAADSSLPAEGIIMEDRTEKAIQGSAQERSCRQTAFCALQRTDATSLLCGGSLFSFGISNEDGSCEIWPSFVQSFILSFIHLFIRLFIHLFVRPISFLAEKGLSAAKQAVCSSSQAVFRKRKEGKWAREDLCK